MRSEPSQVGLSKGGRAHNRPVARREATRSATLRRLALESLESRTLLATQALPTPIVNPTTTGQPGIPVDVSNPSGNSAGGNDRSSAANESTPSIAVDPNNPQHLVEVWIHTDTSLPAPTQTFVEAAYSTDAGQNWTNLPEVSQVLLDPTTSNPIKTFPEVTNPTVAFDRHDDFYILDSHRTADNGTGTIALTKYDFTSSSPSSLFVNNPVYQWSTADAALAPTLAIDNNAPTLTDTDSKGQSRTQTDPNAGNVYVAYGTADHNINNGPSNFNPYRILLQVSSDGGQTFSGPTTINDNANNLTTQVTNEMAGSPEISISQGRSARPAGTNGPNDPGDPGVPGGLVNVVWDDFGTGAKAGTPFDIIWSDRVGGATTGTTNTVGQQFATTTGPINDAIAGLNGAPSISQTTIFNIPVNITNPSFTTLSDLTVTLNIADKGLNALQLILVPPAGSGLPNFTLVNNGINQAGTAITGQGITGTNLGLTVNGGFTYGTTFSDQAVRSIRDGSAAAPYIGKFTPEGGSLDSTYRGATPAQLNGTWELQATVFRTGNPGTLISASLGLTSGLVPNPTGNVQVAETSVRGSTTPLTPNTGFPTASPASNIGVGPGISVASDNTLGAFSEFEGRLYVAYTDMLTGTANQAGNTDIALAVSDDGGQTWTTPSGFSALGLNSFQRVNDDLGATDGFSGADGGNDGRTQFEPQVRVDPTTGTLVMSWLDARNDASNARVADYVTYSLDGGQTFSPQVYVDTPQTALNAITGDTEILGPIPENSNVNANTLFGLGKNQGLAVYGGHVYPAFISNLNGNIDGKARADTYVGIVQIPAGPRVIQGSMGPVQTITVTTTKGPVTINAPAADGTPQASGFIVTFDRPIDPASFTSAKVQVTYRDTTTGNVSGGPVPVTAVYPVPTSTDPNNPNNVYGYTEFVVTFAPRSSVGTYSYVVGPDINDRIRGTMSVTAPVGQPVSTPVDPTTVPVTIPNGGVTPAKSPITITSFPSNEFVNKVTVNVNIKEAQDFGLDLVLVGPDGTTVPLVQSFNNTFGRNFTNTTFDDNGPPLFTGNAPYTGTFAPDGSLAAFKDRPLNGTWTLEAISRFGGSGNVNQIVNWTLTLQAGVVTNATTPGNFMDQNANGTTDEGGATGPALNPGEGLDAFSAPTTSATDPTGTQAPAPFTGPYDSDTLPLVLPGPHIVNSYVPGLNTSLVQNLPVNQLDVVFDRNMDPTSISAASIVRLMGPTGAIIPFTMVADPFGDPSNPDPDPSHPRTYKIAFPTQDLSGTYTVTLASTIRSQAGDELDTNENAGVDLLKGNPGTNATTPVTYNATSSPSSPLPAQITSQGAVVSTLNVPASFAVQGLTLQLNVTYPNDPDLTATLIAPDGTQVQLFTNVGSTGTHANFTNTIFDDAATTPIANGGPPFLGRFLPQQQLSTFNGKNAAGQWKLVIQDSGLSAGTLSSWSLTFQQALPSSGLGEPVADQATASFRIFNSAATNPLASSSWTPVGPAPVTNAPTSNGYSGQIGGIAVDPSDPSGNTVYVGGASGGVWKTTDFLTTNPAGPTYVPLTDFGPTLSLNIGSIAVFGQNNDTNQSIIFAGTGFGDETFDTGFGQTKGVGILRSMDGGATWTLLDSMNNNLPDAFRDHVFSANGGTSTFKIVVDPHPLQNGNVIVYAALGSGPALVGANGTPGIAGGGLWRSDDSGQTWTKLSNDATEGTIATDVSLDLNSATVDVDTNPTGNVNTIYAAFPGHGVYISPNRGTTLDLMAGNGFDPLIRNPFNFNPPQPIPLTNAGPFGGAGGGRIVLSHPALIPSTVPNADVENLLYESWLYAAVADATGHIDGLYLTKDNGSTWTKLVFNNVPPPPNSVSAIALYTIPTNDQNGQPYDVLASPSFPNAEYNLSVDVDPTNPNVVYLGGSSVGQNSGLIRLDTTNVYDSHSLVAFDNNRNDGGASENNTNGRVALRKVTNGLPYVAGPTIDPNLLNGLPPTQVLNLVGDPFNGNPFQTNSTVDVFNVASFTNDGTGVTWLPFDAMLQSSSSDTLPSTNLHRMITEVDPQTGLTRLIIGDDQGIFTGLVNNTTLANGTLGSLSSSNTFTSFSTYSPNTLETTIGGSTAIGGTAVASYSRNGNLQIQQFFYGASQPSSAAAQVAMALYYGNGVHAGINAGDPSVQSNGNLTWTAPSDDLSGIIGQPGTTNTLNGEVDGVGVATSQQAVDANGDRVVYQYLYPGLGGNVTDFFQVSVNGQPFVSRTVGLIQNNVGNIDPQWPIAVPNYGDNIVPSDFAVNPIAGNQVIISSNAGRIFSTTTQGKSWLVIANPTDLDGTYASALAYGAPDPNGPGGVGNLNNFVYAGTVGQAAAGTGTTGGQIFVTQTGGGSSGGSAWTNISSGLDGSSVRAIITNPTRGSHEAYAVTETGVYHTTDSLANVGTTGSIWTNITGNLFQILDTNFGKTTASSKASYLTSVVADWRYAIPDPNNPGATFPVLYVAANSGVYRSIDDGQTWSLFPSMAFDNAPLDGGGLPDVEVSSLSLALGDINPTNGQAQQVTTTPDPNNPGHTVTTTAPDTLLATTYGRGSFQIRLAPDVFPNTATQPNILTIDPADLNGTAADGTPIVTTAGFTISGFSQQTAFGNTVKITVFDLSDPANPIIIGGFDPSNPSGTTVAANETNSSGNFLVTVNPAAFVSNGSKIIGVQATDGSGTTGNIALLDITLQAAISNPNNPPAKPTVSLSPQSDSSGGQGITNDTTPQIIGVTTPGVTVELFLSVNNNPVPGQPLATATADPNGNYVLQFLNPLPNGPVTIQVVAVNSKMLTAVSNPYTFTVNTTKPTVMPSLGLLASNDTGIKGDGITSVRQPLLIGQVDPGTIVDIYNATNFNPASPPKPLALPVTADSTGFYSIQLPGSLANGTIPLVVQAHNVAGNTGPLSPVFNLTIATVPGDYTGGGNADPAVYQRSDPTANWVIQGPTSASVVPFGHGATDIPLAVDFAGTTGTDQLAVYRPSTATWFVAGVFPNTGVVFGEVNVDEPVPADYLGTGKSDLAVYRPTTGEWFIAGEPGPIPFGTTGDVPVPGDYDHLGHAEIAIYRPSTGQFYIRNDVTDKVEVIQAFAAPNEVPVPGQYDNSVGFHATEPAVFNPATGVMTIGADQTVGGVFSIGTNIRTVSFTPGSIPAPGDYDGIGSDEPAAYTATGVLTIAKPGNPAPAPRMVNIGGPGSVPVLAPLSSRAIPVLGDFLGNGQAQLSLFRPTSPQSQLNVAGLPSAVPFGVGSTDIPLLGDFAGNGKTVLAVYRETTGTWFAQSGLSPSGVPFGMAKVDIPAPADYLGTGATQLAVFRPTTGQWFIQGQAGSITLGQAGDVPVPGNYDGTGRAEQAVFEPGNNGPIQWLINGPSGIRTVPFGGPGDIPVPAAYDGGGVTEIAIYRPSTGQWFISGHAKPIPFGGPGDIPVAADFDGVGHDELGVYRPSTGQWFIFGHAGPVQYGGPADIPAAAPLQYRLPASGTVSVKSVAEVAQPSPSVAVTSALVAPAPTTVKAATVTTNLISPSTTTTTRPRPNQAVAKPAKAARTLLHDAALAELYGSLKAAGRRRN